MAEIIEVFKQPIPALRFIGKKYAEFGHWGEWFGNGWFDAVESAMGGTARIKKLWENGGGYIGLECRKEGRPFEYWIGMFAPADTVAPEGFQVLDFDKGNLGVCWIYGKESEVHDTGKCRQALEGIGMEVAPDKSGAVWSFENCVCPRYTAPDGNGNIILDYCYFVK